MDYVTLGVVALASILEWSHSLVVVLTGVLWLRMRFIMLAAGCGMVWTSLRICGAPLVCNTKASYPTDARKCCTADSSRILPRESGAYLYFLVSFFVLSLGAARLLLPFVPCLSSLLLKVDSPDPMVAVIVP